MSEVVKSCDSALEAKNKALEMGDLALKKCKEVNGGLQTTIKDQDEKLNSWTRNPFLMLGIGVLAGGLTYGLLKK